METKFKYIQNTLNTPITANIRKNSKGEYDIHGSVVDTIEFKPAVTDKWSGKVISTGYTKVTEEQYEGLVKSANTWRVYGEKKKFLIVHDDVPADLKTPHEAIRDVRKALTKSQFDNKKLETEITDLKAKLFDAEEKYKELLSASGDSENLKLFNDKIAALEEEVKLLGDEKAVLEQQISDNRPAEDRTIELTNKLESVKNLNAEFVVNLEKQIGKNREAQAILNAYVAKFTEFVEISAV